MLSTQHYVRMTTEVSFLLMSVRMCQKFFLAQHIVNRELIKSICTFYSLEKNLIEHF